MKISNGVKKIIIPLLVLGVLASALPKLSYAQIPIGEEIDFDLPREELLPQTPPTQPNQGQPSQPNKKNLMDSVTGCQITQVFSSIGFSCITQIIAWVVYAVYIFAAWLLAAVANVFNYVLGMTLDNANYSAVGAIKEGWAFSRDVVNLFFIFILLFIAIATILQIESYGAKKLLVWLVLVALLVNFSLIATQFIIYATNSLGILFYRSISASESPFLVSTGIGKPGFRTDIAGAFQKGLSDQTLANAPVTGFTGAKAPDSATTINFTVIIILLAGIILLTFAMIIFAAGAFFMVARLAALWLLMILAPFGFVFLILPMTRGYANRWWQALQSQALFAPAFMFFIIITVKIVQSPFVLDVSKKLTAPGRTTTEFLFLLIIQHIVILVLLGASLIVAKQMGMYGAGAVMGTAKSFGKWVGGYAGRGARRTFAPVAERIATGEGRFARTIQALPFVGKRVAAVPAAGRGRIEDLQKEFAPLNNREIKNNISRFQGFNLVGAVQELVNRGDVALAGNLTDDRLRQAHRIMQRQGINTNDLERLRPDLREPRRRPDGTMETPEESMRIAARRQRPQDIEKLGDELSQPQHAAVIRAIATTASPQNLQRFADRGGPLFDRLIEELRTLTATFTGRREEEVNYLDVANFLQSENINNRAAANFFRTNPAAQIFGFGGRRRREEEEEGTPAGREETPPYRRDAGMGFRGGTTTP